MKKQVKKVLNGSSQKSIRSSLGNKLNSIKEKSSISEEDSRGDKESDSSHSDKHSVKLACSQQEQNVRPLPQLVDNPCNQLQRSSSIGDLG